MPDPHNRIICLNANSGHFEKAAQWFHSKWNVPVRAYLRSMEESLTATGGVPRWYILLNSEEQIIAGLGVIANDFHKRPDLTPNLCALFVEQDYRRQGIARMLLERARRDLARCAIDTVYLITSHTAFYEHCGWTFDGMVEEENGNPMRMYRCQTL